MEKKGAEGGMGGKWEYFNPRIFLEFVGHMRCAACDKMSRCRVGRRPTKENLLFMFIRDILGVKFSSWWVQKQNPPYG
jgi:hypothetical protein